MVRVPCIEEQVQGSKLGWRKAAFVFVLESIFFFSPLKVWGPWSVNGVVFPGMRKYWVQAHCSQFIFHVLIFLFCFIFLCFFSFYLLELKDKKNKMGQ